MFEGANTPRKLGEVRNLEFAESSKDAVDSIENTKGNNHYAFITVITVLRPADR